MKSTDFASKGLYKSNSNNKTMNNINKMFN